MIKGIDYTKYVALYGEGYSTKELAAIAGVNSATMYRALKRRDVIMRNQGEIGRKDKSRKKPDKTHLRAAPYDEISSSYQSGLSLSQTAEKHMVSIGVVRSALKVLGVKGRPKSTEFRKKYKQVSRAGVPILKRRKFDHDAAVKMYKDGMSLNQIARALNVSSEPIRKALANNQIEMRNRGAQIGGEFRTLTGGEKLTKAGYLNKRADYFFGVRGFKHRIIASEVLGRKLKRNEVVHHINCIRSDNRNENLLICSQSYHMQLHQRMLNHPYWSEVAKNAKQNQPHN